MGQFIFIMVKIRFQIIHLLRIMAIIVRAYI